MPIPPPSTDEVVTRGIDDLSACTWDWAEQYPGVSDALSDVIAELDLDTGERPGMTGDQPGSARDAAAMHLL